MNTIIDGSIYDGSTIKIYDFYVNNSNRVLIDGFTIRNCISLDDDGAAIRNGFFNSDGYDKVKLKNLIFENNEQYDILWNGPGQYSIDNVISSNKIRLEYNSVDILNSLISDFRTNYWDGEIQGCTILGDINLFNGGGGLKNSILINPIAQGDQSFSIEYSCLPSLLSKPVAADTCHMGPKYSVI